MIDPSFLIPIALYSVLAVIVMAVGGRGRLLLGAMVFSYCGVYILSFTRGASGGIWPGQVSAVLAMVLVLPRRSLPPFGSRKVARLTYALFALYMLGIVVALARYDAAVESIKAGAFRSFGGIPLSILMAGYRMFVVASLAAAFTLPLRYVIDRALLARCLVVCWMMSVVLGVATVISYLGIINLGYTVRAEMGAVHADLMGFHRCSHGLMMLFGIFLSYAMTQVVKSRTMKTLAWASAPLLIAALLFSWSRSAMLGMAVASISLIVTLGGARAIRAILLSIFGMVIIATDFTSVER